MYLFLAFRVFFAVLFNAKLAQAIRLLLASSGPQAAGEPIPAPPPAAESTSRVAAERPARKGGAPPAAPGRSEAVTLLALLQREGRLVDFLMEPLNDYSDQQVGAAARTMHAACGSVLQRVFELSPVRSESEGTRLEIPAGFDAAAIRLQGSLAGSAPYQGVLQHPGWQARKCELPQWSGSSAAAWVVAPAEVEVNA